MKIRFPIGIIIFVLLALAFLSPVLGVSEENTKELEFARSSPLQTNSSSNIVIDQIFGGGLADQPPDYVVLWNPTTGDINLGNEGFMLSYGEASGQYQSEPYIFQPDDIIPATDYFMVANTNIISGVSADAVCDIDIIINSGVGNSWVVFSNTEGIVDRVGWATDPEFFEETGIQKYLTSSTAFFRGTDVRHLDTGNNNADFYRDDYIPTSSGNVEWFCHTLWPDGDQTTQEWILTDRPSPVCGGYYYRAVNEDFDLVGPPYIESSSKTASHDPPQAWFSLQDMPDGVMDSWGKVFVRVLAWGYQTGVVYTPVAIDSNTAIDWRNVKFGTETSPPGSEQCSGWSYDIDLGPDSNWSKSALDDMKIGIKNETVSPGRVVVVPRICLQVFYTEQATPPPTTSTPVVTPSPVITAIPTLTPVLETTPTPTATPIKTPRPSPTPPPITPIPTPTPENYDGPIKFFIPDGDYDGDGTADVAIYRNGLWAIRGYTRIYFGGATDYPQPGDYDGDWMDDPAIFRSSSGLWAIRGVTRSYYGRDGDLPVARDYDGDGICEIAIFRPSSGLWAAKGATRAYFGTSGDFPLPADFNGDGAAEIVIYRPENSLWAFLSGGRYYYGTSGDLPIVGDFNGVGAASLGIFREKSGLWAIQGLTRAYYGSCGDFASPADFDGDGTTNIAIFRPPSGLWSIREGERYYYGEMGDIPLPMHYRDTDSDRDGLPDWWEERYFPDPGENPNPWDDPDNDEYDNITEYANGTDPTVFDAHPTPTPVPPVAGPISGRVYDWGSGAGLEKIYILVTLAESGSLGGTDSTDNDGTYLIPNLSSGFYHVYARVSSNPYDPNRVYRSQYYYRVDTEAEATVVASNSSGIDFPLTRIPTPTGSPTIPPLTPTPTPIPDTGTISGRVYDHEFGAGIEGLYMRALPTDAGSGNDMRTAFTDFTGNYKIKNLSTGLYYIHTTGNPGGYRSQYYDRVYYPVNATEVAINSEDIDFPLYEIGAYPTPSPIPVFEDKPIKYFIPEGDFNGDGTAEVAIYRKEIGLWAIRGYSRFYYGGAADYPQPGDYNGDGMDDPAIFRPSSGLWAARGVTRSYYGAENDLPVARDYNGDGTCDIAIFRHSSGLWAVRGATRVYFGTSKDFPLPGDFDGDKAAEIAIYRRESGLWAIKGMTRVYYGATGDLPIVGDFNGCGTTGLGIFREASGLWAIRNITRAYFGSVGDLAAPADFNGDQAVEFAIYRPSSGLWAIRGVGRNYFGELGDIPLPMYYRNTDSDCDGLPDWWEARYFPDYNEDTNPRDNPDWDAYDNLTEYANGTDPRMNDPDPIPTPTPADPPPEIEITSPPDGSIINLQ